MKTSAIALSALIAFAAPALAAGEAVAPKTASACTTQTVDCTTTGSVERSHGLTGQQDQAKTEPKLGFEGNPFFPSFR